MVAVEIHEFSTWIKVETTTDGRWISRGFIDRYMNATLPQIPHTVEQAIANELFAVVEGTSSDQPAVIGRVLPGKQTWSVVAVVSRGRDDGGRPLSVYRYFLCQGADSLWKILQWMEEYKQREGHLPIFNPLDVRVVPSEEISRPPEIPSDTLEQQLGNVSVPIVLSWEPRYSLKLINKIAEIKAGEQPVSWAYNVEALENPWNFLIIYPASERAYGSFLQAKANPPSNTTTVEIHEFSTGIKVERTADGGWISRGFTGRYMNATLSQIPHTVERAIANKLFAVVEGTSSDQPAVIGRVLPGKQTWSVVAVVSRGRDDGGRPLSVYRYFLCQGADSLWKILQWMEEYEQREKHLPIFNPLDVRAVPSKEISTPHKIPPNKLEQQFGNESVPILLSREYQYNLRLINKIAEIKAGEQPVSWAYNAEALENPWNFLIIYPASERAYRSFLQFKANPPLAIMPATIDEKALKLAIQNLIGSSQVKPEAVQVITEALGNEQITQKHWHTLFNKEGASNALSQNFYSPQLVRLITLRAMVIPETLPKFLAWLNIKGGRQKPDKNQVISLEFQQVLGSKLPQEQLASGIKLILPKLLEKEITPEAVHWLLAASKSAWKNCRQEFINDVLADLKEIGSFHSSPQGSLSLESKSFRCGDKTWDKLINYLQKNNCSSNSRIEPYYKPLAELFKLLKEYKISSYFYQVSVGTTPKKIFNQAFDKSRSTIKFLDLFIQREVTIDERIIEKLSGVLRFPIENRGFFCTLLGLLLLLGTFSYAWIKITNSLLLPKVDSDQENPSETNITEDTSETCSNQENSTSTTPNDNDRSPTNFDNKKEALQQFSRTSQSIDKIVQQLVEDKELKSKLPENQVAIAIKKVLCNEDLNYAGVITTTPEQPNNSNSDKQKEKKEKEKEKWVEAIYAYQQKKELRSDGIIHDLPEDNESTYSRLKADIEQHLKNSQNDKSDDI